MTLEQLFNKYEDLNNPKISGVEFYRFVSTEDAMDLEVITSLDQAPGQLAISGFDEDDEDRKVGNYLLSFPYQARTLVFETVDDIDKHLIANNNKFKLPGYSY